MGMGVPKFGGSPKFCDTGAGAVDTADFFFFFFQAVNRIPSRKE